MYVCTPLSCITNITDLMPLFLLIYVVAARIYTVDKFKGLTTMVIEYNA